MAGQIAYIDEFGTNSRSFEKEGVSTHFIISCVLIETEKEQQIKDVIEQVRKKYFGPGEIKSSSVGNNDKRRLQILTELVKANFTILSLVVDKTKLEGDGFQFKPSFYKYLNRIAFLELRRVFYDLEIVMDEHGSEKFMTQFISYLRNNYPADLFNSTSNFRFEKSENNVLIQLSDFFAGTLARCYDNTKKSSFSKNFQEVFRNRIAQLSFFPNNYDPYLYEYEATDTKVERVIADLSLKLANDFIAKNEESNDQNISLQVKVLKHLRLYRQTIGLLKYVSTSELLEHLNRSIKEPISKHQFRTNIIAKLRDSRVLIASSKLGYKLPVSKADLFDFVNHSNSVITPMLERLKKCREIIKTATHNEIDILASKEYQNLKKIFEL
jgi:hypothetical protein